MKDSIEFAKAQEHLKKIYPNQNKVLDSVKVYKEDGFLGETTTVYYMSDGQIDTNTTMNKQMVSFLIVTIIMVVIFIMFIKAFLYLRTIAKYIKDKSKQ